MSADFSKPFEWNLTEEELAYEASEEKPEYLRCDWTITWNTITMRVCNKGDFWWFHVYGDWEVHSGWIQEVPKTGKDARLMAETIAKTILCNNPPEKV